MCYLSFTKHPTFYTASHHKNMARAYWGCGPMPKGSKLCGGYTDQYRKGALIRLASGRYVCGNAGIISNIKQPKKGQH